MKEKHFKAIVVLIVLGKGLGMVWDHVIAHAIGVVLLAIAVWIIYSDYRGESK